MVKYINELEAKNINKFIKDSTSSPRCMCMNDLYNLFRKIHY